MATTIADCPPRELPIQRARAMPRASSRGPRLIITRNAPVYTVHARLPVSEMLIARRTILKTSILALSAKALPAAAEENWKGPGEGAINATSSRIPLPFNGSPIKFIPGSNYRLRISGQWNIYGPGSHRWCGAAGSGVPAGDNGWPAPGLPEGCLLIYVGPTLFTMDESNRVPDSSALPAGNVQGVEQPPIYEGVFDGNVNNGDVMVQPNDNNPADNEGALMALVFIQHKFY
jgi:hypothetical protein